MDQVLFWLFMPYDALIFPPHFWLKAIFGIATGLLIPRKMVGLLICALGNAALYIYLSWKHGPNLPADLIALAVWSIFAFVGVCGGLSAGSCVGLFGGLRGFLADFS